MSIAFKDVLALTGSPGLFKVLKTNDSAIVVESLDEHKKRQLVRGNMMVSKLMDVSIYTTEDSEPLVTVMKAIQDKYGKELPVSKKSSKTELLDFLREVLPNFDEERVYPSNVKKLLSWYNILSQYEVEFELEESEEGEAGEKKEKQTAANKEKKEKKKEKPGPKSSREL